MMTHVNIKVCIPLLIALLLLTGCAGTDGGGQEQAKIPETVFMRDIFVEVNDSFGDYPAITMGMDFEDAMIQDLMGIPLEAVKDYGGQMSMTMTNSDVFLGLRANPGKVEEVKNALEVRLADLQAQFEQYPVMGSKDRADAGEVYVVGDCVFLIVIGIVPEDQPEGPYDFSEDVQKTKDIIDSFRE